MEDTMKKVLDFQSDGLASPWSWAFWNSNISLLSTNVSSLTALTLCVRIFLPFYRNNHTFLFVSNDKYLEYLSISFAPTATNLYYGNHHAWAPVFVVPGFWNSICSQIDFVEAMWLLYVNDEKFITSLNITSDMTTPTPLVVMLGQNPGRNNEHLSYRGKITDFNMWHSLLNCEELSMYSACELDSEGSLLKWEPEKMILNGSTSIVSVSIDKVCRPNGVYKVLLSPPLLYPVTVSICGTLGGNLSTEGSLEYAVFEQPRLLALRTNPFQREIQNIVSLKNEEKFRYFHEKEKWKRIQNLMKRGYSYGKVSSSSAFHPLRHVKPIKKRSIPSFQASPSPFERLINPEVEEDAMLGGEKPMSEELGFTAYCEFQKPPVFKVGGFCPDVGDVVEENYVVLGRQDETELPLFQGFTGRRITYSNGDWVATGDHSSYLEMWLKQPSSAPPVNPMGRNEWLLLITVNDELLEEDVKLPCDSEILFLRFSSCSAGYFTCNDASCLPHSVRCDRKADCLDGSDEDYCYKIDVPETNRDYLPAKPMEGTNVTEVELKVLINRAKIELDIMTISADIWVTWKDPSLVFYNLHMDPLANMVDVETLNKIWIPTIEFGNNGEKKIIANNQSEMSVLKESFGEFENYEFSWEAMNYKGAENSIQLKVRADIDSKCTFNTFLFPFGLQTCSFRFALTSALANVASLSSSGLHGGVSWSGCNDDLKYDISSIQLRQKKGQMYSSQELVIDVYPRLGLALLTLYFPSLFIVIITLGSLYPSPTQLEIRIGSALACLIALLVLQSQAGTPLMSKTGLNAGDIWLFGAILIVFGVNVVHIKVAKELYSIEELRPSTSQVVPMTMMNGKTTNVHVNSSSANLVKAWTISNKWRKRFIRLTIVVVVIYILAFVILTEVYKS